MSQSQRLSPNPSDDEPNAAQVSLAAWDSFYKPLWLLSALLNSGYSYFWDLERDWDIHAFTGRSGAASHPSNLGPDALGPQMVDQAPDMALSRHCS